MYIYTLFLIGPGPPINVRCPQSSLDVSLEISWTAPINPNGRIVQYLINLKEQSRTILTSSAATTENVEGLLPGLKHNHLTA